MAMNSASIYRSIEPVVRHYWGLEANGPETVKIMDKVCDVESTEEPTMEATEYGGPGTMTYKPENERITFDDIVQGGTKRWSAGTWATGIEISMEAAEDTKYKAIKTASRAMGRAGALTPEYLWAQFMDRSFDTGFPALSDGLPICSQTHVIPKGGTYSNMLATAFPLSEMSLEQIFQNLALMNWTDGMVSPLMPKTLIVQTTKSIDAWKLMNTQLQMGSANNDRSFVAGKLDVVSSPYFGSTTRYWVKTNAMDGLFWKWRIALQFFRDNVDQLTMALFMSRFRAYWGIIDGRGVFGVNAVA